MGFLGQDAEEHLRGNRAPDDADSGKMRMPFASNDGVRLHWDEKGQGSPVVLVMGHRYSAALWYPIVDTLAAEHRVIWYDNRGTGRSDTSRRVSIADFVRDTLTVMDAAGVNKAHIFGVSMGGGIVLELALRHPDRACSVILGCTCMLTPDKPRTPAWVRALYFLPPWILKALKKTDVANSGYGSAADPADVAHDLAILANDPFTVPGVAAQAAAIAAYSITREAVATVALPALVLHGDEDGTVPYAWGVELAETLPDSEMVTLAGAGHNFLVASPAKSREAIMNFLGRIEGPRTPSALSA